MNIISYESWFICFSEDEVKDIKNNNITEDDGGYIAIHEDLVKKVRGSLPDEQQLYELSDLFRVFADSTRVKILYAMMDTELCVNDIAQLLGISQSSVSHQLRVLKDAKLVKFRRDGKAIFYSLDDEHVSMIINMGLEHITEK